MSALPPQVPASVDNLWRRSASVFVAAFVLLSLVLGFIVLPLRDQGRLGPFAAICRALGIPGYARIPPLLTGPASPPASLVAWTPETRALLRCSATRGAAVVKDVCSACHGEDGKSVDPTQFPNLTGQSASAIFKELHDFKSGDRKSDIMGPVAQQLSDQQIADVAVYYAAQKRADLMAAASGVDLDIVRLARIGAPFPHARKHRERRVQIAPKHHGHGVLEIVECHVLQRRYLDHADIIHQHIYATECCKHQAHHSIDIVMASDVTLSCKHVRRSLREIQSSAL